MHWMDPLPVTCENCGNEAKYAVEDLRNLTATCQTCGASLAQVGKDMIRAEKNVSSVALSVCFIMDLEPELGIEFSDEEIEPLNQLTVGQLIQIAQKKTTTDISIRSMVEKLLEKHLKNKPESVQDTDRIQDLFFYDI